MLAGNDSVSGSTGSEELRGYGGNDTLDGKAGADLMTGGLGNDTYIVDHTGDTVIELPGEGNDTAKSSVTWSLAGSPNLEHLTLTGTAHINATGNDANNYLTGNSGNNHLDGGLGNDTLAGGGGSDLYILDGPGDVVLEAAGGGIDAIESSVNLTLAANVENLTLIGPFALNGTGNALANLITGNTGNNLLDGGAGNDTLIGGAGDDTYIVDVSGDLIEDSTGTDAVIANLTTGTYTLADKPGLENLTLGGTAAIQGVGNALNNQMLGNSAANRLSGGNGDDYLEGGAGNDTLDGGLGSDTLIGGTGNDTYVVDDMGDEVVETSTLATEIDTVFSSIDYELGNNVENLTLMPGGGNLSGAGNALANVITGNATDNELEGKGGADTLIGGLGDDTYIVNLKTTGTGAAAQAAFEDSITEAAGGGNHDRIDLRGTASNTVATTLSLAGVLANIEHLDASQTGSTLLNLTGNAAANELYGNDAANILDGRAGIDALHGEDGDDTYLVDNAGDRTYEDADKGIDLVKVGIATANGSYTLEANVEHGTLTNAVAFSLTGNVLNNLLTGNAVANTLTGGDGNDTLDGLGGADSLIGGAGDDTYVVDNASDVVTEAFGEGIDAVKSSITYTLADPDLEVLILTGAGAINGTGNNADNVIVGNAAANSLVGGGGIDVIDGGAGNDTLDGGSGIDFMTGGAGNDTYVVDNPGDAIAETSTLVTEIDTVRSSLSFDLSQAAHEQLENLTLTGSSNITGNGNAKANTIIGNDGRNTLTGGGGADILQGGKENDLYNVNLIKSGTLATLEDTVTENLNEGFDGITLINTVALDTATTLILGANIESLDAAFTGTTKLNLTGNALDNALAGNSAANILNGLAGADNMFGYGGNDTYIVDNTGDQVTEFDAADGTDLVEVNIATAGLNYTLTEFVENAKLTNTVAFNLIGNALDNVLTGNAAANTQIGGDGNDTLDGGAGVDYMGGGAGNDTYVVDATGDIVEDIGGGIDTVVAKLATGTYELTSEGVENLILSGTASINGRGNELANLLVGNDAANKLEGLDDDDRLEGWGGNDTLDGGLGVDTMIGGAGNDTYVVDSSSDLTEEDAGALAGVDLVLSSVDLSLAANIENLTLTGTAVQGFGNTLANRITGNASGNILDGNEGADTLDGGLGDDTYQVDLKTVGNVAMLEDTVIEAVGGGTDTLMLLGSGTNTVASKISLEGTNLENLAADNTGTTLLNLTGNAANNIITGNDADNLIDGGLGTDGMNGGLGNDTYVLDNAGDSVTETSAVGGIDTLKIRFGSAGGTYVLGNGNNLENVTLTNTVAFHVTGNELNNALTGNAAANSLVGGLGNDTLDGLGGIDTLNGGDGDDTYVVDVSGDVIQDSDGTDTVLAKLASGTYTLAAGLENLTLGGAAAINGVGNAAGNQILGNNAANSLSGGGGNDQLIDMGGGNDTLDGGAGADVMMGGLGSDTYIVDDSFDTVTENIAIPTDIDTVLSSVTFTLGDNLENLTLTGAGNINGTGNALNNKIIGNSGNNRLTDTAGGNDSLVGGDGSDTLSGGASVDTLVGGTGSDRYEVNLVVATGALEDVIVEVAGAAGGANDVIVLQNSATNTVVSTLTLATDIEHLYASNTGITKLNLTGNASNNILVGNAADNIFDGGVGADSLTGGDGNDTYIVDNAGDVITENSGEGTDLVKIRIATAGGSYTLEANVEHGTLTNTVAYNITGNALANALTGNAAVNSLSGGEGNDTLDGLGGIDTLNGGDGDDTYVVDVSGDVIQDSDGTDTVLAKLASGTYTLAAGLENLTLGGAAAINGTGNTFDNTLVGNDAANVLDGKAGADILRGGKGNDTYVVDDAGDLVQETQNEGTDLVSSSVDFDLASAPNVENLTLTGTDDINGSGNTLANVITGNAGANQLRGDGGNDTLTGNEGADTIYGGDGNDSLVGGAGNDTLEGNAGNDVMIGGDGDDTYYVDSASDVVTETSVAPSNDRVISAISYVLGANVEHLTLSGVQNINGTGNALNNVLTGNDGDNVLNGGAGVDTFAGGLGNDTYLIDSANEIATITELSGEGDDDTLIVGFNTVINNAIDLSGFYPNLANIEHVTLTGTGNFDLIGNDADNYLVGNAANNHIEGRGGNDTLDGKAGADYMIGGTGNDIYYVDNVNDQVQELTGEGAADTVFSSVSFTLQDSNGYSAYVENLTLVAGSAALNATGNTLANILTGNAAANILDGWMGNDTMIGGAGNDTYKVHDAGDVTTESAGEGTDTVISTVTHTLQDNVENLTLNAGMSDINGTGNTLNNVITGDAYNNSLSGLAGNDTLIGGAGADILNGDEGLDSMSGGNDDDQYYVDNAGDVVVEALAGGTGDRVVSSISYTLAANVEFLALSGTDNLNGTGNALNNTLDGNSGNNILDGGAGNDTLAGENGNDTYIIDRLSDVVFEGGGMGTDLVKVNIAASGTYVLPDNVENATLINAVAFNLTGNFSSNVLTGNAAANILSGGGGDTLVGGAGNDVYRIDVPGVAVTIVEAALGGIDRIETTFSIGSLDSVEIEQLTYIGAANFTGSGTAVANTLTGSTGNDSLSGLAGNDSLIGNAGNDSLDGGVGNDTLVGGDGNDTYTIDSLTDSIIENGVDPYDIVNVAWTFAGTYTMAANVEMAFITTETPGINLNGNAGGNELYGNNQANVLDGKAGNDKLIGNGGNDTLIGGLGDDSMWGGLGDDVYRVDSSGDAVYESSDQGTDRIETTLDFIDLTVSSGLQNVENLTFAGTGNFHGIGNGLDNVIIGGAGSDTLDGLGGKDTLIGGLGNDTYVFGPETDVVELAGGGIDTVQSSFMSVSLADKVNLEHVTLIGSFNINATGNGLANTLTGNDGHNSLDGGAGNDSLVGGAGNDSLYGGAGSDTLVGGKGSDTYYIDVLTDKVIESAGDQFEEGLNDTVYVSLAGAGTYTLDANVERAFISNETVGVNLNGHSGGGGLWGNNQANILDGKVGDDSLTGNGGDDTLIGGLGDDTMWGGQGNDVYRVDSLGDVVNENLNEGTDRIETTLNVVDFSAVQHVEHFAFNGVGTFNVIGNTLANSITGGAGNDTLDGFVGDDTLIGGLGNDVYKVDSLGDVVTEAVGGGTDLVLSAIDYDLGVNVANIENLTLTGTAMAAIGNALANTLTGNDGDNWLDGGAGNDSLVGGAGNDSLYGGAGSDTLIGGAGDDTYRIDVLADNLVEAADEGTDLVYVSLSLAGTYTLGANIERAWVNVVTPGINLTGNALDNLLIGGDQANKLDGAAGNDILTGDDGDDTLIGGAGNDSLLGGTGFDTLTGGEGSDHFWFNKVDAGADVITDFVSGIDVIELYVGEFTGLGNDGDLVGLSDHLLYDSATGALSYDADGVGGNDAVQFATLGTTTHPAMLGADFLLAT